jgi:hypothetical protein
MIKDKIAETKTAADAGAPAAKAPYYDNSAPAVQAAPVMGASPAPWSANANMQFSLGGGADGAAPAAAATQAAWSAAAPAPAPWSAKEASPAEEQEDKPAVTGSHNSYLGAGLLGSVADHPAAAAARAQMNLQQVLGFAFVSCRDLNVIFIHYPG